jgi:hypothetical protein
MIDRATIDRIIDTADIVDVVSEFVSLQKRGTSYKGLCPFHDDRTPSFSVSPSRGVYKCFACGKAGNTGKFCSDCGQPKPDDGWTCECGAKNTGKFCSECGKPRPAGDWICACGAKNSGKFCAECGKPRP